MPTLVETCIALPCLMTVRLTWDNTHFFADINDPRIEETAQHLKSEIAELRSICQPYAELIKATDALPEANYGDQIDNIKQIHQRRMAVVEALRNVSTFI